MNSSQQIMKKRILGHHLVGIVLLLAGLACSLVPEGTITDDKRLVRSERPALLLLSPQQGSTYALGTPLVFHAIAQDEVGISRIEVNIDQPDEPLILTYRVDPPATEIELVLPWMPPNSQLYLIGVLAFREGGDPSDLGDDIPSNEILLSVDVLPNVLVEPPPTVLFPDATEAPTDAAQPTSAPIPDSNLPLLNALVNSVESVPVRQGPGTQYAIVQTFNSGDILSVVGRSEDGVWLVVPVAGGYGWIVKDAVILPGPTDDLAVVAAPPLPEE